MNIDIIPVAITQINWQSYIKICQDELDVHPQRSLDADGLNLSPKAFIGSLSLDEKPKINLAYPNSTWNHVSASFVITADDDPELIILSNLGVHITIKYHRRSNFIVASGTMFEWYNAIMHGCKPHQPKIIRYTMNLIQMYFANHDFQELWGDCSRSTLTDGTFTLS